MAGADAVLPDKLSKDWLKQKGWKVCEYARKGGEHKGYKDTYYKPPTAMLEKPGAKTKKFIRAGQRGLTPKEAREFIVALQDRGGVRPSQLPRPAPTLIPR
eukprot:gene16996-13347_t